MRAAWFFLLAALAAAQTDQTGSITGVVTDAITHMPVKKTLVTVGAIGNVTRPTAQQSTMTDVSGAFAVTNLAAGKYSVMFQQQNYPQARFGGTLKTIEVKAGEAAGPLNMELIPGGSVSGHIVDEDGDPLPNCYVQVHPQKHPDQGVPMMGGSGSNQDGEYRLFGIAPGKYILSAQCGASVFQARPFSAGPDPQPSRAYPMQYYPLASDAKSAQAVELTPANDKSGVDFQMAPTAVTQIRGTCSPGWNGVPLILQMNPFTEHGMSGGMNMGAQVNPDKGTFEFRQVFAGSYLLVAYTQGNDENRMGVFQRVDVGDKPLDLAIELKHAIDLSGKIEIENSGNSTNKLTPNQVNIQLVPQYQFGMPGSGSQMNDDGTFTLKNVLPAPWRLQLNSIGFIKAAWLGSVDVTNAPLDLSSGAVGVLRIVISTKTASIGGSAPPGEQIYAMRIDPDAPPSNSNWSSGAQADQNGQYKFAALAPGKYRLVLMGAGGPIPDEGQEVTVREGETVTVDLKPAP